MITLKAVMINGNWRRIPMILTHTPAGWKERPADKEDRDERSNKRKAG